MSRTKRLDMTIEKLAKIAEEINKNTIENRNRSKKDKITTDKFIRKFNITRKDFSETIKGTGIEYNRSTFLYDIPKKYLDGNTIVIPKENEDFNKDDTKMLPEKNIENYNLNEGNTKALPKDETIVLNKKMADAIKNVIKTNYPEIEEIKDIISWYKEHKEKENIIEVPEININNPKLKGEVISKSFKTYGDVISEFVAFCKSRKETQKDLLALAMVEFIEKYKK
ncbi:MULTISPECIES: hypothetical protein [Clostridium]|jgi:hypothetical protein|uniref:hypothetical protein n=1 Tax=Clostridium TaxID=1485 RepID=UPI00242ECB83|nr:hypothetical protein [Clostridium tyrobutyricum]